MFASKKIVTISADGGHLHFVAVKRGWRGFELASWMTLPNDPQRDSLALRPEIDEFYRRAGVDKNQTVVEIPRAKVAIRTLQFPKAVLENLTHIIEYQVENYEPIDRADLAYVHQRVDDASPTGPSAWMNPLALLSRFASGKARKPGAPVAQEKLEVLLAMAPRAEVEHQREFWAGFGIYPQAMLCGSFGLARLLQLDPGAGRERNFLLRVGENDFELIAVFLGKIRRAQRFEFLSSEPQARAEHMLLELGRSRAELRIEEKDVHNVYVTGADPESYLKEFRSSSTSLPLRPLRVPACLRSRANLTEFHALAPAIGDSLLAMSKGGLATDLMGRAEHIAHPRWVWAPTYAFCGLAVLMAGASASGPYLQQSRFVDQLSSEITRLQPQVRQVERIETEANEVRKKAAVLDAVQGRDALNLEALRELTEILPDSVWINDFYLRADGVEINGLAENATALVPLIEQSPLFKDVALASGITRNQQGKEMFRIRAKFEF
ncbi:MAG: PilN domain-containing protein [Acidobacteriia bacterium]|nr:PilN domain-containing protein [Terriglobia bacterium]